jgi:hypothetical protein
VVKKEKKDCHKKRKRKRIKDISFGGYYVYKEKG